MQQSSYKLQSRAIYTPTASKFVKEKPYAQYSKISDLLINHSKHAMHVNKLFYLL